MRYLRLGTVIILVVALFFTGQTIVRDARSDKTPPIICDAQGSIHISVKDDPSVMLAGLTATDDRDGDVTENIRIERISRLSDDGSVDVSFVVFDNANNMCRHIRTVFYDDYQSPRFTLTQPLVYYTGQTVAVMDRLKLTDSLSGDITHKVKLEASNVNNDQVGQYEVSLAAVTDYGDEVHARLPINIQKYDALAPMIQLSDYLVYTKVGEPIHPKDYITEIKDFNGFPIDINVVFVFNQVDFSKPGGGQFRLEVSDGDGRTGYSYLSVIVEE